jgi:uncharacterized protein (UPF0333 family)
MGAVTIPLISNTIGSTMQVSGASDMKNAVSNIANAVNLVYANGPGSKRTIDVYTPGTIIADNNLKIIRGDTSYTNSVTNQPFYINASTNYNVNLNNPNPSKGWHKVTVEWTLPNTGPITITIT